ncbi:hypothetical protein SAMN05216566_11718 [Aureimonas phyllosphaerae]|jgi:hypothetical protein|uniref:Uncharacterized protein n=1 Tax=Aureimonas phyllosphaerae TaxID=1166078 RepID=A0A7W6BVQ6_9HYPH|nr:hypothetical protein [Aureimonas phyllosphaerae]MBB3961173.1 hypothetical protein [Aureimonas phyllosphaerae]SFF48782.1 hypothetical protein SAMN05216566_11718 [Aureimonas phyllosphaerae]
MGEKNKGGKEARKPKKVVEKTIAAAPSLKGGTTPASKKS